MGWLVPQLYFICCLPREKTKPSEIHLATQTTSANWHSNKAERAAVCRPDWWTNMKSSLPFPIVWLFNQTQASEAGINMHGESLSPFCFSVKRHSLSVFLCLSRWYPPVHQWMMLRVALCTEFSSVLSECRQKNPEGNLLKEFTLVLVFSISFALFHPHTPPHTNKTEKQLVWRISFFLAISWIRLDWTG